MKKVLVVVCTLFFASVSMAQDLNSITWVTEEYPPFNYSQDGVATGITVDLLLEIWKRAGVNKTAKDIKVWPWSRGYEMTKKKTGLCLFGMTVTEPRKDLFKFVSPIPAGAGNVIIAKKSKNMKIDGVDQLKNYNIGVILKDIGEQLLLDRGINAKDLDHCNTTDCLIKKLEKDRVDAISYSYESTVYHMKQLGIDHTQYEIVYFLMEDHIGYAFHKDTDPAIIETLQKALDEIRKDGTGKKINAKYQ